MPNAWHRYRDRLHLYITVKNLHFEQSKMHRKSCSHIPNTSHSACHFFSIFSLKLRAITFTPLYIKTFQTKYWPISIPTPTHTPLNYQLIQPGITVILGIITSHGCSELGLPCFLLHCTITPHLRFLDDLA